MNPAPSAEFGSDQRHVDIVLGLVPRIYNDRRHVHGAFMVNMSYLADICPHPPDITDHVAREGAYGASKVKPEAKPVELSIFSHPAAAITFVVLSCLCCRRWWWWWH